MGRRGGMHQWTQAAQVLAYVTYALSASVLSSAGRAVCWCLGLLLPAFLAGPFQRAAAVQPTNTRRALEADEKSKLDVIEEDDERSDADDDESEADAELYYDAAELVQRRGYPFEQHYAVTSDDFLLGLHRIPHGRNESSGASSSPRPVAYLMHGLLQSSESFIATRENLAFTLADAGFDVWLGNARGNKYSAHHRRLSHTDDAYWDFGIDDLAAKDLPAALSYVSHITGAASIGYVGFSQGAAAAFACFSTRFDVASRINSFVALAPATQARGFSQPVLDRAVKMWPELVFFLFGRGDMMGRVIELAQRRLPTRTFVRIVDESMRRLFGWSMRRVSPRDKPVVYTHIWSRTSVKSLAHWFQVMRAGKFQMYQEGGVERGENDSKQTNEERPQTGEARTAARATRRSSRATARAPAAYRSRASPLYPVSQLSCRVHVMWGSDDHLPDTRALLASLPVHATHQRLDRYEHIDFLYARDAARDVWPEVVERLRRDAIEYENTAVRHAQMMMTHGSTTPLLRDAPYATSTLHNGSMRSTSPTHSHHSRRSLDDTASHASHLASLEHPPRRVSSSSPARSGRASPAPSTLSSLVGTEEGHVSDASSASPSSSSRQCALASAFANAVMKRDDARCVVCGARDSAAQVRATHILTPTGVDAPAALNSARLLHGYETTNGLALCCECGGAFSRSLWYVLPSDGRTLVVSQSLVASSSLWSSRVGGVVSTPTRFKRHWPPPSVFAAHQKRVEQEWQRERRSHASRLAHAATSEANHGQPLLEEDTEPDESGSQW